MRLNYLFLFLLLLSASTLDSCKKGENDPKVSFRTRKNRVVGEWKLNTGSYRHYSSGGGAYAGGDFYSLSETAYIVTEDVPGQALPNVYGGSYSRSFKFEKDGNVRIYERFDNFTSIINGTWDFNVGVDTYKSKELITIHFNNVTQSGSSNTTLTGNQKDITYSIIELRNKKMVLKYEQTKTQPNGTKEEVIENIELKS